jgi:hypothetical protein
VGTIGEEAAESVVVAVSLDFCEGKFLVGTKPTMWCDVDVAKIRAPHPAGRLKTGGSHSTVGKFPSIEF